MSWCARRMPPLNRRKPTKLSLEGLCYHLIMRVVRTVVISPSTLSCPRKVYAEPWEPDAGIYLTSRRILPRTSTGSCRDYCLYLASYDTHDIANTYFLFIFLITLTFQLNSEEVLPSASFWTSRGHTHMFCLLPPGTRLRFYRA